MSSLMIYINIYIIIILLWRSWPASPRAAFDPGRVGGTEAVVVVGDRMCVSGVFTLSLSQGRAEYGPRELQTLIT